MIRRARLLPGLLAAGFLVPSLVAGQASASPPNPADWCPAGDRERACGDAFFGGCPVSECRRLLRRIAYASEAEAGSLKQQYEDRCVADGACEILQRKLQALAAEWSEIYRRVEGQCSPDIDLEVLAELPTLEERCSRSPAASLHRRLRHLRCQILQAGGRNCPDEESIPCPVPPEAVKPLLNPRRQLCPYPEHSPLPIYRCTGGAERATLGALCPGSLQAAEERPDCRKWTEIDLPQLASAAGVEELHVVALLPEMTALGDGWLERLGGPAPDARLRLSSWTAWTIAPRSRLAGGDPLFVIAADGEGAIYTGRTTAAGLELRRAEGWEEQQLAAEDLCSRSVPERHRSDWRALQRELLRAESAFRPLVEGEETVVEPYRISVRCFADPATAATLAGTVCLRLLTEPPGRPHEQLEVNVEAWEPLRLDWYLPAAALAAETLHPFVRALADQAAPFHLLAADVDRGTALVHQDGTLGVLAGADGEMRRWPTSRLLETLLRRWLAPGGDPDLDPARTLTERQLSLPGALLVHDPTAVTPPRSCWLTADSAVRCFSDGAGDGDGDTLLDPQRYWGPAAELASATEELRAGLVTAEAPGLRLTPPLQELITGDDPAPVLDLPRLDQTWLALRQKAAVKSHDGACRISLRLEDRRGTADVEVAALLGGDLPAADACEPILATSYATLRQALIGHLDRHREHGPLRLIVRLPEEGRGAPTVSTLVFREGGEDHLLFFPHDAARDGFGPYRWECLAAEASREGYGRFAVDSRGLEDFVGCVFDPQHACRQRRPKDPQLWLSPESQANPCLSLDKETGR